MRDALREATMARVKDVLRHKRRRYYEEAAQRVACCVELARAEGEGGEAERWVATLRKETSRFSAFQAALQEALARASP
jgi:hypothetical protein